MKVFKINFKYYISDGQESFLKIGHTKTIYTKMPFHLYKTNNGLGLYFHTSNYIFINLRVFELKDIINK